MSISDDTSSLWGAPVPTGKLTDDPTVESALQKDMMIRDIVQLREGLQGLLVRITEVGEENRKLGKDNEMLGVYIDNLSVRNVRRSYIC